MNGYYNAQSFCSIMWRGTSWLTMKSLELSVLAAKISVKYHKLWCILLTNLLIFKLWQKVIHWFMLLSSIGQTVESYRFWMYFAAS